MSEHRLTENDYTEIKALDTSALKTYITEVADDIEYLTRENDIRPTPALQGQIEEMYVWLKAYRDELATRTVITTPECRGCKDGVLNQQGHYGGCLEEPGSDFCPY